MKRLELKEMNGRSLIELCFNRVSCKTKIDTEIDENNISVNRSFSL